MIKGDHFHRQHVPGTHSEIHIAITTTRKLSFQKKSDALWKNMVWLWVINVFFLFDFHSYFVYGSSVSSSSSTLNSHDNNDNHIRCIMIDSNDHNNHDMEQEEGGGGTLVASIVPLHRINDNYCDCPLDGGADEYLTDACSGAYDGGWAGVHHGNIIVEPQLGDQHGSTTKSTKPPIFTCPQQPAVHLFSSRLNDGICDCCDGADEWRNMQIQCPNTCEEEKKKQRRILHERQNSFTIGFKQRQLELNKFQQLQHGVSKAIEELRNGTEIQLLREEIRMVAKRIKDQNENLRNARRRTLEDIVSSSSPSNVVNELFGDNSVLSANEIVEIIVAMCQLSGEDNSALAIASGAVSNRNGKGNSNNSDEEGDERDGGAIMKSFGTEYSNLLASMKAKKEGTGFDLESSCLALLKAGQDVGYKWQSQMDGSSYTCTAVKPSFKGKHGNGQQTNGAEPRDTSQSSEKQDREDTYDSFASVLSQSRDAFRRRAQEILDQIQTLYDNHEGEDSDSEDVGWSDDSYDVENADRDMQMYNEDDELLEIRDENSKGGADEIKSSENHRRNSPPRKRGKSDGRKRDSEAMEDRINIDPLALQMVRNVLNDHMKCIERGNRFAKTARQLLDSFILLLNLPRNEEGRSSGSWSDIQVAHLAELKYLALATLWHSRVNSADFSIILYNILPEFVSNYNGSSDERSDNGAQGEFTNADSVCQKATHLRRMCPPPPATTRTTAKGIDVVIPPKLLVAALDKQCDKWNASEDTSNAFSCNAEQEGSALTIPTNVPDGYHGFHKFVHRDDSMNNCDAFAPILAPIGGRPNEYDDTLLVRKTQLKMKERETQDKLKEAENKIGGPERRYGSDGILHAFKDQCFSVESGKYEYEICFFGKAWQREAGEKTKGMLLGTWMGPRLDDESGRFQLIFEGGTKCWNGPQRSAHVWVSCGPKTKLIGADEPATCQYVLELESYIACDEKYASENCLDM